MIGKRSPYPSNSGGGRIYAVIQDQAEKGEDSDLVRPQKYMKTYED